MIIKNTTFAIGLSWLLYGATTFNYPDWDIGVSLVMAFSTYFTADKVITRLRSLDWRKLPMAAIYTWVSVDGSYTIYWFIVDRTVLLVMRDGQWLTSLCLFLLCGMLWSVRLEDLRQSLGNLKAIAGAKPE